MLKLTRQIINKVGIIKYRGEDTFTFKVKWRPVKLDSKKWSVFARKCNELKYLKFLFSLLTLVPSPNPVFSDWVKQDVIILLVDAYYNYRGNSIDPD